MKIIDPLSEKELVIENLSQARYALKEASNFYFAQIHMKEQMEKELSRSETENYNVKFALVGVTVEGKFNYIPDPLPADTPQYKRDAIAELDAQMVIERQRAERELQQNCQSLKATYEKLTKQVAEWFKKAVNETAAVYDGVVISGCKLNLVGGDVKFTWTELTYD